MKREQTESPVFKQSAFIFLLLNLLVALPLGIWLYVYNFQDVYYFFSQSDSILRSGYKYFYIFSLVVGVGLIYISSPTHWKYWSFPYILLGVWGDFILWTKTAEYYGLPAAFLFFPVWFWAILALRERSKKPRLEGGNWGLWIRVFLSIVSIFIITTSLHAVYVLTIQKFLSPDLSTATILVLRVADWGLKIAFPFFLFLLALTWLTKWLAQKISWAALLPLIFISTLITSSVLLVLRVLDLHFLRASNILFSFGLCFPYSVFIFILLDRNGSQNIAYSLNRLIHLSLLKFWPKKDQAPWWATTLFSLLILLLFLPLEYGVIYLHWHLTWGPGTSLLYMWFLLIPSFLLFSALSLKIQSALIKFALIIGLLGSIFWVIGGPALDARFARYKKYDKIVQFFHRIKNLSFPTKDKDLVKLRKNIEKSYNYEWSDLRKSPPLPLTFRKEWRRKKPNIIWIVSDALRYDDYGRKPYDESYFSGMAKLMERAVKYENAWTSYNATTGSVPAFLEGSLHPVWLYVIMKKKKKDYAIFEATRRKDYKLYCYTAMKMLTDQCALRSTYLPPMPGALAGDPKVVFRKVIKVFDEAKRKDGHFFYIHTFNTHYPFLKRKGARYVEDKTFHIKTMYRHNIDHFDRQLKWLLSALEARKMRKNTLLIVTADHGDEYFEFGNIFHGFQLNPYVMRVPLFIQYPDYVKDKSARPRKEKMPVNLIDITPSILDAIGIHLPRISEAQGISLLKLRPEKAFQRVFPLLSWRTKKMGIVSFVPKEQVSIVNSLDGEYTTFYPIEQTWKMDFSYNIPKGLIPLLNQELDIIYKYFETLKKGLPKIHHSK